MIKKFTKLTALMLCFILLMAGCQGAASTTAETPSPGTDASSAESTQSKEEIESNGTEKLSATERTLTVLLTDSPNQPLSNFAPAQQAIFDKTNIKLDYQIVPNSNYQDKKNILLATNNMPDIAYVSKADILDFGPSGIFLPLKSYIEDMPNFSRFWNEYPDMAKSLVNDELYALQIVARNETANGAGPVIRTDLLQKHDLATPKSYDELLDVLEELKNQYPDSRPFTGRKGTPQLIKTMAYMLGSGDGIYYDFDKDGGKYIYGPATEEFKEVLRFLNSAYVRGVLDPDFATTTSEQFESRLTSGQSFFFNDNNGFSVNFTSALKEIEPEGKLQAIPFLTNSFGQRRAMAYATTLPGRHYAISAGIEDPDTVMKFIDWMYSDAGSDVTNYGVEGLSFEYNEQGKPEFITEYLLPFKDATPSAYYGVFSELGITKLNFCLYAGNTEQMFAIDKAVGNWNEDFDALWGLMEEENGEDGAFKQPIADPPFSQADAERIKEITLDLNTMLEQEYDKHIMGTVEIDGWDAVIARANELGAKELEEIYARANAPYVG